MSAENFTEFTLSKDAYAAFDAVSMKSLIISRLKESNIFTDQAFEGSNLSSLIDIIAYAYHVTLFYLNNQASEAYFNQATLYENLNKIVNLIGYNPNGSQTSILSFTAQAQSNLAVDNYVIPRFSYVISNGITYSLASDVYFEKTTTSSETLESIGQQNLLYQGQFKEYPLQTALGQEFETLTIAVDSIITNADEFIDYNNIFVFIKNVNTEVWSEWKVVPSLFDQNSNSKVFEKRLNEGGRYELKFGDGITGKKLNEGDQITIYYLQSTGSRGVVSALTFNNSKFVRFTTPQFRLISSDVYSTTPLISQDNLNYVLITNNNRSTNPRSLETVEEIRANAPKVFAAQNRAVTANDFDIYVRRNFSNLIHDISVMSNTEYIDSVVKYLYDIGIERPNDDSRVLLSQIRFADSCDFNNVYIFVVPRNFIVSNNIPLSIPDSLKQLIVTSLENLKMQNIEVVIIDPVYMALDLAVKGQDETAAVSFRDNTNLVIKRSSNSRISLNQIKTNVYNAIADFFDISNITLGSSLDFSTLTKNVLAIPGVESVSTVRQTADTVYEVSGFSFVSWNPYYDTEDISITQQNLKFPNFKFPFFAGFETLNDRIIVS